MDLLCIRNMFYNYNLKLVVVANIQSDVNSKANNSGGNDAYPNLY